MPEVFFNGPAGRLEGRFHPTKQRGAPIAVVLGIFARGQARRVSARTLYVISSVFGT